MLYKGKELTYAALYELSDKSLTYASISGRLCRLTKTVLNPTDEQILFCLRPANKKNKVRMLEGRPQAAVDYKGQVYHRSVFVAKFLPGMSINSFVYKTMQCGLSPQDVIDGKSGPKMKKKKDENFSGLITAKLFPPTSASFDASYKKSWRLR